MKLELNSPTDLLNKAYLKQPPVRSELELFCSSLSNLLTHLQTGIWWKDTKTLPPPTPPTKSRRF